MQHSKINRSIKLESQKSSPQISHGTYSVVHIIVRDPTAADG